MDMIESEPRVAVQSLLTFGTRNMTALGCQTPTVTKLGIGAIELVPVERGSV
jgi:hypothetical protein